MLVENAESAATGDVIGFDELAPGYVINNCEERIPRRSAGR